MMLLRTALTRIGQAAEDLACLPVKARKGAVFEDDSQHGRKSTCSSPYVRIVCLLGPCEVADERHVILRNIRTVSVSISVSPACPRCLSKVLTFALAPSSCRAPSSNWRPPLVFVDSERRVDPIGEQRTEYRSTWYEYRQESTLQDAATARNINSTKTHHWQKGVFIFMYRTVYCTLQYAFR